MASTYSALKIELIGTGDQSGTWGATTNTNLGDAALGEAITGSADVDFASAADVTVTLTNVNTTQSARNLRLNITESGAGIGYVGNLILGSGCQIEKFYLINNTGTGAKTVKNTTGTGISVPAGKATLVFNNGTNVVDAASYFSSLTLGAALPVASGGTGSTTNAGTAYALKGANSDITSLSGLTTALSVAQGGTGTTSSTGTGSVVLSATPTLTGNPVINSTGSLTLPVGTTGQRPSPTTGMLRYNSTSTSFEGYNGTAWSSVGGATISNDTTTATFEYPLFAAATSGTALTVYTGNANLLYKPSTGEFQAAELAANNGLILNNATVSASYTIASGYNASSVGPMTINSGITVTISSGQRWLVQ